MQNISGRWITHFLKSLPHLLRNLSGIRHFRLESRIKYPDFTFALIQRPARAAILRCLRENPLETLEVDSVAIPWELLCALPRSLQCLKLGGSWWLGGSDDYLVDKEMLESEQEPPLTVSPKVLHFNLHLDFAKILPAISANLQELVLQLDSFEISISGANELRDTLQSSLHAVISLPTLETLGFIINYTNYAGRIACPPRLIEIVDGYISQTVLPQIRALQITTTWNPRQACYPSPSRELDYEAFDGSWDTLDTSLTGLPTLELFKLTLMIEDESIRQDSSAIELLRSQREAEMAVLFPNARSRGMKVVMICGIIYRDFHIFSPNVR
ncbi:hypothetical protein BKA70DRAFT_1283119 [Coprinopsis sp. MPI-PUGE-AT-0042]|nr:hypothetical protein BKA70DRAFT_1283119 [Coprinopsis sp. MPI-PUGE-AT-0042]